MSETRAHFELKEVEYLNGSLFVENQLRQTGIGFEIWDRICAQNGMSGNSYPSSVNCYCICNAEF